MAFLHRQLPPLPPSKDGRTQPPSTTDNSSQSFVPFLGNGSRQGSHHARCSSRCRHLNDSITPDMWCFRQCLGPQFDEASENLLASHRREREEYEKERRLQFRSTRSRPDPPRFLEPPVSSTGPRARGFTRRSTPCNRVASANSTPSENIQSLPSPTRTPTHTCRYVGLETLINADETTSRRLQRAPLPAAPEQRSQVPTALETPDSSNTPGTTSATGTSQHSSPGELFGHITQPASPTAEGAYDEYSKRHDSFNQRSEDQASSSSSSNTPLHAPTPQRSIPVLRSSHHASEDLSGYPPKMRESLGKSAYMINQAIESLGPAVTYEIYEDRVYADKTVPREVVGGFRGRHTANIEAAKLFVHRFWRQVMEENHGYDVDMGKDGLVRMDITLDGADDGMVAACVGVCKRVGQD